MAEITIEQLSKIRADQHPARAPSGAGYWLVSEEDRYQIEKSFSGDLSFFYPAARRSDIARMFGSPVVRAEGETIRFVLWCEHCGHWLRWDGTGHCQRCYHFIPGTAGIQHDAMIAAARKRWPEMAGEPTIIDASPGSTGLEMALGHQEPLGENLPDRLLEKRPPIQMEHIALEDVGPYRLGYGPRSGVLYVGEGVE